MITLDKLQEQLKTCIDQRGQAEQMFHRLSGAAQLLEQQIKLLEGEGHGDADSEGEKEATE